MGLAKLRNSTRDTIAFIEQTSVDFTWSIIGPDGGYKKRVMFDFGEETGMSLTINGAVTTGDTFRDLADWARVQGTVEAAVPVADGVIIVFTNGETPVVTSGTEGSHVVNIAEGYYCGDKLDAVIRLTLKAVDDQITYGDLILELQKAYSEAGAPVYVTITDGDTIFVSWDLLSNTLSIERSFGATVADIVSEINNTFDPAFVVKASYAGDGTAEVTLTSEPLVIQPSHTTYSFRVWGFADSSWTQQPVPVANLDLNGSVTFPLSVRYLERVWVEVFEVKGTGVITPALGLIDG